MTVVLSCRTHGEMTPRLSADFGQSVEEMACYPVAHFSGPMSETPNVCLSMLLPFRFAALLTLWASYLGA